MSYNPRIKAGDRRHPTTAANAKAASAQVATSPGWIYSVSGYNSGAAQFVQIHDAASTVADATNCLHTLPVGAQQWFSFEFPGGLRVFNGIFLCNSSTDVAKTIGAADCQFVCAYSIKP